MKKILTTLVCLLAVVAAYAQGTVNFANIVGTTLNQPITLADGTTRLDGPTFMAELLGGASAGSLVPIATVGFNPGGGAGYFLGGTQIIPGVPGGEVAFIQVRAWNTAAGANYAAAFAAGTGGMENAYGISTVFSVATGNPNASPPGTPAALVGLQSFSLNPIPEPSTFVLAGLGFASLLLFRRRK
jgi:hypothetical protein